MKNLQALHGTHLLISDKVFETELAELVGSPGVQLAKNLAFLDTTHFFADIRGVGIEEGLAFAGIPIRVASVGILTHFVAREGR